MNYTYDDYGNRISKNGMLYGYYEWHDYSYDIFNRLTNVSICGSYTQDYTYDGDNIRQSVTESYSEPVTEIYDGGNLVARKQGTNTHTYIYGLEQEFYMSGNNFGIYSTNHRGDISKEIQLNTNTEKTRAYSAYGVSIASAYSNISPFGYAGEVRENTGLTYLRNRYYDEETGTFMTMDPIKDGLNWYAYCAGNPVMFVDPLGLKLKLRGTPDEVQEIMNNIKKLSHDELTLIQDKVNLGNGEYRYLDSYTVSVTNEKNGKYEVGTELIRRIVNSDYTCNVVVNNGNLGSLTTPSNEMAYKKSGIHTDVEISLRTVEDVAVSTRNETGIINNEKMPRYIALGHEFIHAIRYMDGNSKSHIKTLGVYCTIIDGKAQDVNQLIEELETTGISYEKKDGTIVNVWNWKTTENALRDEHGLNRRIKY